MVLRLAGGIGGPVVGGELRVIVKAMTLAQAIDTALSVARLEDRFVVEEASRFRTPLGS